MESSIKQWHKSLLFSCFALALLVQAVPVNAQVSWLGGVNYVLNEYEYAGSGGEWLDGVEFQSNEAVDYQLAIYHDFTFDSGTNTGVLNGLVALQDGSFAAAGTHSVDSFSPIAMGAGNKYYVVLGLKDTLGAGADFPVDGSYSGSDGSYTSDDYEFGNVGASYPWTDVTGIRWAITPIFTSSGPTTNIEVTDEAGNWSKDIEIYDGDSTLTVAVTATDNGPYDMEITVTGDMDPIAINGTITNSTSADWDGLSIQLGYGLGEDFELATDGLSFALIGGNQYVSLDPILAGDDDSALFGINMGGNNVFTARMFAIPEPSSLVLLAISGLALLALGRRSR